MNSAISEFYFKRPEKRLGDIDHLMGYLEQLINGTLLVHGYSSSAATHLFYSPPTHSALGDVCAEAFAVLKKLDADEEFQQYLQDKKNGTIRPSETDWFWHHVIVPLLSSPKVETPLPALVLTVDNIKLLLDDIPVYWQHDIAVLLDVHRIIGDGIRSDGTIRLDLVLKYYLITPSSPQTAVQWTAALDRLKELRAAFVLGHDGQFSDLDPIMDEYDDKCIL
ncbi:hypothetical protein OH720_14910 [Pseudomonas sp. WJP1]|uniref:hypothetical protein n=1 Tax=Pseudomonas sp. WJP1 TaxID=2986947 RepID=UPI00234B7910|nr:hypothetical protein [Pseudomonas sp. WJP1]WCM54235.1 hypothetical protein OH720_14910 [Pseudomonas sp. WJP1]